MNTEHSASLKEKILKTIETGNVAMRPRSHFVLLAVLAFSGAILVFALVVFIASLIFFFLHESGAWFALPFGPRGWFLFPESISVTLVFLGALFAFILERLLHRYPIGYRTPVLLSVGAIVSTVFLCGFLISLTPLHSILSHSSRRGELPAPINFWYGDMVRRPHPSDVHRGVIVSRTTHTLVITDPDGDGTWPVVISRQTRLPYGEGFELGDMVLVIGDLDASGTIQAFGVRMIEEGTGR